MSICNCFLCGSCCLCSDICVRIVDKPKGRVEISMFPFLQTHSEIFWNESAAWIGICIHNWIIAVTNESKDTTTSDHSLTYPATRLAPAGPWPQMALYQIILPFETGRFSLIVQGHWGIRVSVSISKLEVELGVQATAAPLLCSTRTEI